MKIDVDLQPEEYRRAMIWHQFASTPGKRLNDWAAWAILVCVPLTIILLLLFAPDALSIWFWPVALLALLYSAYSALLVRYQIRGQSATLLQTNPALKNTQYHIHSKGIKLTSTTKPSEENGRGDGQEDDEENNKSTALFLPWKEILKVAEYRESFLFFVTEENILIVPKRCVADESALRGLLRRAGKIAV